MHTQFNLLLIIGSFVKTPKTVQSCLQSLYQTEFGYSCYRLVNWETCLPSSCIVNAYHTQRIQFFALIAIQPIEPTHEVYDQLEVKGLIRQTLAL